LFCRITFAIVKEILSPTDHTCFRIETRLLHSEVFPNKSSITDYREVTSSISDEFTEGKQDRLSEFLFNNNK
jgi:hypothetical protein